MTSGWQVALAVLALIVSGALTGCGSQIKTTLPDNSAMPPRGDLAADRARATEGMRELAQKKAEQTEAAKEIEKSR